MSRLIRRGFVGRGFARLGYWLEESAAMRGLDVDFCLRIADSSGICAFKGMYLYSYRKVIVRVNCGEYTLVSS